MFIFGEMKNSGFPAQPVSKVGQAVAEVVTVVTEDSKVVVVPVDASVARSKELVDNDVEVSDEEEDDADEDIVDDVGDRDEDKDEDDVNVSEADDELMVVAAIAEEISVSDKLVDEEEDEKGVVELLDASEDDISEEDTGVDELPDAEGEVAGSDELLVDKTSEVEDDEDGKSEDVLSEEDAALSMDDELADDDELGVGELDGDELVDEELVVGEFVDEDSKEVVTEEIVLDDASGLAVVAFMVMVVCVIPPQEQALLYSAGWQNGVT
ncbi:hypothetical protein HYFRA_00007130 [Hymenoscyphus fraxineus]|uniref:Uncharacterized protein n=1 Tax=Hymenoscyphus fraxineus TaxID=746836 RepID=A0A9N9PTE5_9HELO|nr:hypothetical protein HYFRA_00007130 [Hymenoscyphus fraxineus]